MDESVATQKNILEYIRLRKESSTAYAPLPLSLPLVRSTSCMLEMSYHVYNQGNSRSKISTQHAIFRANLSTMSASRQRVWNRESEYWATAIYGILHGGNSRSSMMYFYCPYWTLRFHTEIWTPFYQKGSRLSRRHVRICSAMDPRHSFAKYPSKYPRGFQPDSKLISSQP